MFTRSVRYSTAALIWFGLGMVMGCGGTLPPSSPADTNALTGHDTASVDPHDVPLTDAEINELRAQTADWTAAQEHLKSYRDMIQQEASGPNPAAAHRPLDLLDHVLQWLPEIAQNSNVPREHWQAIGENAQKLRDSFNEIHANMDAGKAPGYASVAGDIDQAIEALNAITLDEAAEAN